MSYVDLMGNVRWNEQQHVRRTEALVRAHWTLEDEAILTVKVLGADRGRYALNAQDLADIADLEQLRYAAQQAGVAARVDSALLGAALDHEEAQAALAALPLPDPGADGEPLPDPKAAQRAELLLVLVAASDDTLALVIERAACRAAQDPPAREEVQP